MREQIKKELRDIFCMMAVCAIAILTFWAMYTFL